MAETLSVWEKIKKLKAVLYSEMWHVVKRQQLIGRDGDKAGPQKEVGAVRRTKKRTFRRIQPVY